MPPITPPSLASLTTPKPLHRTFHTSSSARASILFALHSLSNSRETQHFAKLTRLPRTEHSPPLKLIKTSEVDTFPLPSPPKPTPPRPLIRPVGGPASSARIWDHRALQLGRTILTNHARQTHRLQKSLLRAKRRSARHTALLHRSRLAWQTEHKRLRNEMRWAGVWILASIATATGLGMWRFWPEGGREVRDSGELGRKIAARAVGAMALPRAVVGEGSKGVVGEEAVTTGVGGTAVSIEPTMTAPIAVPVQSPKAAVARSEVDTSVQEPTRSWWKSLFWKQQ